MKDYIEGLHHITFIAGDPQANLDFYTGILGQRFIKKTVNFDDPGTYHFYFADYNGSPGTVMTSFPWPNATRGKSGAGQCTKTLYVANENSLGYWKERLAKFHIPFREKKVFSKNVLEFSDPDGIEIEIHGLEDYPKVAPWKNSPVPTEHELLGFFGVTLLLNNKAETANLLTSVMGYELKASEGNRHRYIAKNSGLASVVDIIEDPLAPAGDQAVGTVHHIAFRVPNDEAHKFWRERFINAGMTPTPFIDRDYFHSIYFRTPGGVLFEIATENPGFDKDEPLERLGEELRIPKQHEIIADKIAKVVQPITIPNPIEFS